MFFLPSFGWLLIIMGSLMFCTWRWNDIKRAGLGSRHVYIPMLVIIVAVALSGIAVDGSVGDKVAPLGAGISLFAVYLSARVLGERLFFPLAIGAAVASLGVILYQCFNPGEVSGGYAFGSNYDVVVGYVLLGAAVLFHRWRWLLSGLSLLAMLATGSPEALFVLTVAGIVVLIRRDWSWLLTSFAVAGVLFIGLWFALGHGQQLYAYLSSTLRDEQSAAQANAGVTRQPFSYRFEQIGAAMTHIEPFGTGFSLTEFREGIVHNVPLIIVQQLGYPGILAGIAWLWVTVYCLVRTRWKYAWVLVLALSVFDHYVWTQLAPLWWAVAGASTVVNRSDLIFRTVHSRRMYDDDSTMRTTNGVSTDS